MGDSDVKMTNAELKAKYSEHHSVCALCGIPEDKTPYHRWPPGLQLSHIIGGPSRLNEEWNVLLLCELCHRAHHNSNVVSSTSQRWHNVTTDILLAAKKELAELDTDLLSKLWSVTSSYIDDRSSVDIPKFFIKQRERWNRTCW